MGVMLLGLPWCRSWAEPLPGDPAASVREQPEAGVAADPRECLLLGQRYENGIGVPQDLDRALGRYCEAAHLWLADARYHLGWLYGSGRLGKIDEVLAAPWFKSALALGHPRASQQLQCLEATNLDLEADLACVLRDAMVAHRIIDLRPPAAPSRPAESDPKSDSPHPPEIGSADIIALVQRLAPDYRLDPNLVLAVIETESNFAIDALSPKNAQGLMQLVPATAECFGVANVWDPVDNLRGGMAYLRWLLDHFNGDVELALARYNAGEQAVARHGGIPPYPETQAYVKRIQRRLGAETGPKGERADLTTTEGRRT
ncbi:MAG: transglycosylase SLT domain-containing protein [Chromatiaceae bacterium]|nr:transglycosylase SLT domain-containing protein [Chromatiaceae bacterium]